METILSQRRSEGIGTSIVCAASASGNENRLDRSKIDVLYLFCLYGGETMKAKSLIKLPTKEVVKLQTLDKLAAVPKELRLAFPKEFKAAVVTDKKGSPRYFVFDTYSLWDLLCAFDEKFEEEVST